MEAVSRKRKQWNVRDLLLLTTICAFVMILFVSQRQLAKERARSLELANTIARRGPELPAVGIYQNSQGRTIYFQSRGKIQSRVARGIGYYHRGEIWPTYSLSNQPIQLLGWISVPNPELLKHPLQVEVELLGPGHKSFGQGTSGWLPSDGVQSLNFPLTLNPQAETPSGFYFLRLHLVNAESALVTSSLTMVELK